jgi:hypothetical protein
MRFILSQRRTPGARFADVQALQLPSSFAPTMLREFTDYSGGTWRVWDVTPQSRQKSEKRGLRITPVDGWLVFESDTERRRLGPIPEGWESGDDAALSYLCARAKVIPRHVRGYSRDANG